MKSLSLLAALLLPFSFSPLDVKPIDGPSTTNQCGDNLTWDYDSESHTLTITGTGAMWDYQQYDTEWMKYADSITKLCIDDRVDYIGAHAFSYFTMLNSVDLPDSLTAIGDYAFKDCHFLMYVQFPEGLTEIGDGVFYKACLQDTVLPDNVQTLGSSAFAYNTLLTSIGLPDGLRSIGEECFANCPNLWNISIPETVTEIGEDIFEHDTAWFQKQKDAFVIFGNGFLYRYLGDDAEVVLPETVQRIGRHCFTKQVYTYNANRDYYELSHVPRTDIAALTLPESVTEIPEGLCQNMTGLEKVQFGSNVRSVPYQAFLGCTALQTVRLPDKLQNIEDSAFAGCSELTDISIPDTVQTIGENAFHENLWLKNAGDYVIVGDKLLYLYQGRNKVVTVPDGVKAVCPGAFWRSETVSVTLPRSVRQLWSRSLACASLIDITLNEGLTSIPENACSVSAFFQEVTIPESVTEISKAAFQTSKSFTVNGIPGSAAEDFANEKGLPFSDLNNAAEGTDMTLDPEKDLWSFTNEYTVFGGSFYISDEDKALLDSHGLEMETEWSGSCYGLCVTVILAKTGIISPEQIDRNAASVHEIQPSEAVQSMINYYQATQGPDPMQFNSMHERTTQRIYRMIRTAQKIPHGQPPFLVCYETDSSGCHAATVCGCEDGSWDYMDKHWEHRILLYDPNRTGIRDERCIYYDAETLEMCIPHYNLSFTGNSDRNQPEFMVCSDLNLLNQYPYPFEKRFGTGFLTGDVNDDGTVTAEDAVLLQKWLTALPETVLPAWRAADTNNSGTVNAADLTLLKQLILSQ